EPYGLRWFEEAGDPLDYQLNARLAEHYPLALATGENLFSMQDTRNLIRFGGVRRGLDVLQMDPALSYGLTEYLRTICAVEQEGLSRSALIPHGGHQFGLSIAAGLGLGGTESYPGICQPFGGFADGIAVNNGRVALPQVPGVGFESKSELFAAMRTV
ncbi:MAG: enolase C-terminal domain-like protein, partial [Propioniciclava sp.]